MIYFLFIVLCFYILGSTADGYLSPALEKLAESLGLSESLAGVTLLALGNGAPDIISSLSAASSDTGGMFLAVGSLTGAGLFVTGVVSAVVILSSPKTIHVLGKGLIRDTGFYTLALTVLIVAALTGELSFVFGIIFLSIYVLFVITVVVMEKWESSQKEKRKEFRKTLMIKRATVGSVTDGEQSVLDDADLDEDAYYYKDENDHLVEVKIEKEDEEEDDGSFKNRFDRMMTDSADALNTSYEDDEETSIQLDKQQPQYGNELKPTSGFKINESVIKNTDKELRYSLLPQIQEMETFIDKDKTNETEENTKHKLDPSLTDQIEKMKIEPSKNLSNFIIEDHYEEEEVLRKTNKANIKRLKNVSKIAQNTKHKIVWSMLKMTKFLKKGIEGEESFSEKGIFGKIMFIFLEAPLDFIRRLTIPPGDHEQWNRRIAAIVPFTSILFVFTVTGILDYKSAPPIAFYIAEGIALILSILI